MEDTQIKYMLKNGISEEDCKACSKSIVGSIKSYAKHLIICSGDSSSWRSHIAEAGVPQKIAAALEKCNNELKKKVDIIVTATDFSFNIGSESAVQIISYPEGAIYSVQSNSDFYLFMRDVIMGKEFAAQDPSSGTAIEDGKASDIDTKNSDSMKIARDDVASHSNVPMICVPHPLPWKTVILVCVHASRDNRCGRAGPQVIEEFKSQLSLRSITEDSITVAGSSHIGGHKYAGVLVVYPLGDWYGLISKRCVGELLDHIIAGTKYLKGWRGNESMDW